MKLLDIIIFISYKKKVNKWIKKRLIWAYIHFEGDQIKILNFFQTKQTISDWQVDDELKVANARVKDYITVIEKNFPKYCERHNITLKPCLVLRKLL